MVTATALMRNPNYHRAGDSLDKLTPARTENLECP
jgi:hypothetical protein